LEERLIISGFGGQGILFSGKLWAEIMMHQGHHVTYFPSYGAEVRGGTCNCSVIASDDEIAMPVIDAATSLIVMNQPSLERFAPLLAPGGLAVINGSMAELRGHLPVRVVYSPPATDMASELGNVRVANVIMVGVYSAAGGLADFDAVSAQLGRMLRGRKEHLLDINRRALALGQEWMAKHTPDADA